MRRARGFSDAGDFRTMADPARRHAMAEVARKARAKDAQAAIHFERALHCLRKGLPSNVRRLGRDGTICLSNDWRQRGNVDIGPLFA